MHVSACLPVLLVACASSQAAKLSKTMNATAESFRVSAEIARYGYKTVAGAEYTFVYGNVSVENGGPVAQTFELDAVRLSFDDNVSKGAYVDSVAHVMPSFAVGPGTAVRRDVYWVFDGRVPLPKLNEVQLLYMRVRAK